MPLLLPAEAEAPQTEGAPLSIRGPIAAGIAAAALLWTPLTASAAPLPPGFFGVVPQAPPAALEFSRMSGVVGTMRIPFNWAQLEPEAGRYEFAALDAEVLAAAGAGIRVLPFVGSTPTWISADPNRPPLGSGRARRAWASFLRVLVGRYGPGGSLWRGQARTMPIRRWQIWNEPNFLLFWRPRPSPRGYARLLGVAARAIRASDPGAEIVLAGVAPVGAGLWPWVFLRRLYRVPGVKKDFDLVAVHPYAAKVSDMVEQIESARYVMAEAGDAGTRLLVTEVGVASWGSFPSTFVKGPAGQARFLRDSFARLLAKRARWRLAGIDWFTWRDQAAPDRRCSFCQGAGLLDVDGNPKPAWWAFARTVRRAGGAGVR
jgi:hypothetical protein